MLSRTAYLSACGIMAVALLFCFSNSVQAATKTSWSLVSLNKTDTDGDGLSDWKEANLYHTDVSARDTDGDGENDWQELMKLPKHIYISLKYQELRYYSGPYLMDDFLVSTGVPGKDTPSGDFSVLRKVPTVLYQGPGYYLPNTKWNLLFKPSYYVHGAYWHTNFGNKMSHGCVNVSYADVKPLYDWADVGTPITILTGDFTAGLAMTFPSNTLVLDGQTIYLIMNGKKYGFTSMDVFTGLGYSMANVQKRSSAGISKGNVLNSSNSSHLAGSWVISGQTVYYAAETGLIPVPTWEIFLSNNHNVYLLRANAGDLSREILPIMSALDFRVGQ